MRLILVPDPTSPNGEDAFCREISRRAGPRGHEARIVVAPNGPPGAAAETLAAQGYAADADAVIVNSLQPAPLLAAKAAGTPRVLRLIDAYHGASPEALAEVQRFAAAADLLLVPSRYMAGLVSAWGVQPERVRVIPYAYDQIFAQQIALVTVRASRPRGFGLVCAGAVDAASLPALEAVLSAVARLRLDCHLTVIGEGPALPALKAKAEALVMGDRVAFLGALPHAKTMEYLRAAKAYIEPTGRHGFPSLSLHALSEGCPVIGAKAGAVDELIRDGENGLLYPPGDAQALADRIITLATTPGLSLRLIAEGVRTVERHSWDATAAATLEAVESLGVRAS